MSNLQDAVAKLAAMPRAIQQELKAKAAPGSPILPASLVLENVDRLVALLPCLSRAEAGGMLAATGAKARLSAPQLVGKLVPYLDENYPALRDQLWEVPLLVGAFGSTVIEQALREVNRARRSRGAVELMTLDALIAIHQNEAMQAQQEGREVPTATAVDAAVLEQYPAALDAFLAKSGAEREMLVVGDFTLRDLGYLREVKAYIRQHNPQLADPMQGDSLRYYRLAMQLLEQARVRRMGPMTAAQQWATKQQRAAQPNALFAPLDGQGAPRWGGIYPSVRVKETVLQAQPTDEVVRPSQRTRVLTLHGERLLEQFRTTVIYGKYGPTPHPTMQTAAAMELETERSRLLHQEAQGEETPTWRWDVSPAELGFEMTEVEMEVDRPDYGLSAWEGVPIVEAMEQLIEFHRSVSGEDPVPPMPL